MLTQYLGHNKNLMPMLFLKAITHISEGAKSRTTKI